MNKKELQDVGEAVAKQKRPKKSEQMKPQTTPEENKALLRYALEIYNLPPIDISDIKQIQDRVLWYLEHCKNSGMIPGVAGVCGALGIHRDTWNAWYRGDSRGKTPEYSDTVKKTTQLFESILEQMTVSGKINIISGIFMFKNHFGYADKQEVVVTPNNPLDGDKDVAALEEQYKASVPIDTEGTEVEGAESE